MADEEQVDSAYQAYLAEIEQYEKEFKSWETRGKKILRLYKDVDNQSGKKKRFNILWSNVQTLKPALYARDPQPEAERRFKDADPVGRVASEVIERCVSYTIDCQDMGQAMRQVVDDRLLPGRGIVWARYEPTFEAVQITDSNEDDEEELSYEEVIPDYVYWEDFGHNIARTWDEVTLVWRKVYMSRAKLVKRFKEEGQDIPLDWSPRGIKDDKQGEHLKKACIYELWDREKGTVNFLSKAKPKLIESVDVPIKITGGFPCPRPLYATLTNDSLVPIPDYALYQTQAQEIEELTARINALQKALKAAGVYDASAPALAQLLGEGYENKMIPVEEWHKFSEKGGVQGSVDWLPIKEIAEALIALYEAREKSKEDLYEITGIADIIRGNSDSRETATAQQIKGRFAVLRISEAQTDVQRFARDLIRIMAEIIAENFSLETIKAISGVKLLMAEEKAMLQQAMQQHEQQVQAAQQPPQPGQPPQPQQPPPPPPAPEETLELLDQPTWEEVHALLSHQVLREFRIDVETDSTIRTDEEADRIERTEFLTAAGGYLKSATEVTAMAPELKPLLAEMLMFAVRGYKSARNLEPAFEDAMREIQKPQQPKPDPEMAKVEGELKLKQAEAQMKAQAEQQKMQMSVQTEQAKQQAQHQEELQRQTLEDARADREHQRSMELEHFKAQQEIQVKREVALIDQQTKLEVARIQAAQAERDSQRDTALRDKEIDEHSKQAEADSERNADVQYHKVDTDAKVKTETAKQSAKAKDK